MNTMTRDTAATILATNGHRVAEPFTPPHPLDRSARATEWHAAAAKRLGPEPAVPHAVTRTAICLVVELDRRLTAEEFKRLEHHLHHELRGGETIRDVALVLAAACAATGPGTAEGLT